MPPGSFDFSISSILVAIFGFSLFIMAVVLHEWGHGFAAWCFGDDTAKRAGRLSLNPIVHIDPLGSILLPLIGWVVGLFTGTSILFGWAKPVPVNPANFKHLRIGDLVVSLAGVAMNFLLMVLMFFLFRVTNEELFLKQAMLNFGLIYLNLLPVPPLDGYHVALDLMPSSLGDKIRRFVNGREPAFLLGFFILINTPIGNILFAPFGPMFHSIARFFLGLFGVFYA